MLLQSTPDFRAIAIQFEFQFLLFPGLNMRNGFKPRQVGRAEGTLRDTVKNQTVITNQPVDRQKKFAALAELLGTEGNPEPNDRRLVRTEFL